MIVFKQSGNFKDTDRFLKRASTVDYLHILEKYGREGVNALASVTPMDSGLTANSWNYEINQSSAGYTITWNNTHVEDGVNIAIILQYGHGTRNGGYVQGRDYINPAIKHIFDGLAEEAWREVSKR